MATDTFGSPDRDDYDYDRSYNRSTGMMSPPPSDLSETSFNAAMRANFARRRGSPDFSDDEDGSDEDDLTLAMRYPRNSISSTSSITMEERLEAMQKANEELKKKLKEAEDTLRHRMEDADERLESLEVELQQTKEDLSLARKQEKELKSKEVGHKSTFVLSFRAKTLCSGKVTLRSSHLSIK